MRASVTSLSKKFISTFFAATLALGLVPVAAFAVDDDGLQSIPEGSEGAVPVATSAEEEGRDVLALPSDTDPSADGDGADSASEDGSDNDIINQAMPLKTVAQQESTRSYFLAQTLESTKTVPIVSANLPLDKGAGDRPQVGANGEGTADAENGAIDGDSSVSVENKGPSRDEDSEDFNESDLGDALFDSGIVSDVSTESTVVGSFEYRGLTYAVEPGGESVALMAVDHARLPSEFVEAQTVVLPSTATSDGIDSYSVTRIADYAFISLASNAVAEEPSIDITAVTVSASVTSIGDDAFRGANTLQYVITSKENPAYSQYDGCLYDAEQTCLLLVPEGRLGAVHIAPNVVSIDSEVFSYCSSVDTLVADADSAAYRLLSEADFNNANNELLVVAAPDNEASLMLDSSMLANYEGLMIAEEAHVYTIEDSQGKARSAVVDRIYETADLFAAADSSGNQTTEIEELFTFTPIEDKPGEASVSARSTNIAGAISIPFSCMIDGEAYKVSQVASYGFVNCTNIVSVTIPNSVSIVGTGAFQNCQSLENLSFPSDVDGGLSIGAYLFGNTFGAAHSKVRELYIPACVTSIEDRFLNFNTSVQTVTVDPDNETYCSVDGILFSKDRRTLLRCPASWKADSMVNGAGFTYSIPSSVTSVNACAFHSNTTIKEMHIPDSVAYIGPTAIKNMPLLEDLYSYGTPVVELAQTQEAACHKPLIIHCIQDAEAAWLAVKESPQNWAGSDDIQVEVVDNEGYFQLEEESKDKEKLTASIKAVDDRAKLKGAVVIPSTFYDANDGLTYTVTGIAYRGFGNCQNITSVTIPNTVNTIEGWAFNACSSLHTLSLPSDVEGGLVFVDYLFGTMDVSKREQVKELYIPACVTSIPDRFLNFNTSVQTVTVDPDNETYCSVDGILFSKDRRTLLRCPASWKADSMVNGAGFTYSIPSSVTSVNGNAFHSNTTIKEMHIPDSVAYIGMNMIKGMPLLADIYSYGSPEVHTVQTQEASCHERLTIHCIQEGESAWRAVKEDAANVSRDWIDIDIIDNSDFFKPFSKDPATLTMSISAVDDRSKLKGAIAVPSEFYVEEDGITYTVTAIADWGFSNCSNITSISIPNTVTSIGRTAFGRCSQLESISFPSDVPGGLTIDGYLFEDDSAKVKELYIPACVTSIADNFLNFNTSVQTVTVDPDNETYCSVDGILFSKDRRTLLRCPASWKADSMANGAGFTYSIPSSVTSVNGNAFHSNTTIKEIHIPDSVSYIGMDAIKNMPLLADIYSYGSPGVHTVQTQEKPCHERLTIHCIRGAEPSWRAVKEDPANAYRDWIDIDVILEAFTVIFDDNGKPDAHMPQNQTISSGSKIAYVEPVCNGWKFLGWYKNDPACQPENAFDWSALEESATLYAKWDSDPIVYSVTYNEGAATTSAGNTKLTYTVEDSPFGFKAPFRAGSVFDGWVVTLVESGMGNLSVTNNAKPDATVRPGSRHTYGDLMVTARYANYSYKVEYRDSESGQLISDETQSGVYGEELILAPGELKTAKTGHHVSGWRVGNAENAPVVEGMNGILSTFDEAAPSEDGQTVTLYSIWSPNEYSIVLHDGSRTDTQGGFIFGTSANVACPDSFVRPGYAVSGWSLTENGSVVFSGANAAITNIPTGYVPDHEGILDLYAVWTARNYDLYLSMGEAGKTLPANASGWTRGIWNDGDWTTVEGDVDESVVYTYKRDVKHAVGQVITLPMPVGGMKRLSGWTGGATNEIQAIDGADGSVSYAFTASSSASDIDERVYTLLTAQWGEASYVLEWTFNYRDSENVVVNDTYVDEDLAFNGSALVMPAAFGSAVELPVIKSECYGFLGWFSTKEAAIAARYTSPTPESDIFGNYLQNDGQGGYVFEPMNDQGRTVIRFFAAWSEDPVPYTITLKADKETTGHAGLFSNNPNTSNKSKDIIVLANEYDKGKENQDLYLKINKPVSQEAGWEFSRWIDAETGLPLEVGDIVKRGSANRIFVAEWKTTDDDYTISFRKGLEVASAPDYVTIIAGAAQSSFKANTEAIVVPTLSKYETTGFVFQGWYRATETEDGLMLTDDRIEKDAVFTGQELVNKASSLNTTELLYVAKWVPKTFEIRYLDGEGNEMETFEGDGINRSAAYTDEIMIPVPAFKKPGAIFSHWNDSAETKPLYPNETLTVSQLIQAVGFEKEGDSFVVKVNASWAHIVSSSVPLIVNIVFDPDRMEESLSVSDAWISTSYEEPLFVESVTLEQGEDASMVFAVAGENGADVDMSRLVKLTVKGNTKENADPLRLDLGQSSIVRDVEAHGLGRFTKDNRIDIVYDLDFSDPACPAPAEFKYLNEYGGIKDTNNAYTIAKLFYTLGVVPSASAEPKD